MRPLLIVMSLALTACGPTYKIAVRIASVTQPCRVYLEPVRIEDLRVGNRSERQWQSKKTADGQASWLKDKKAFASTFRDELLRRAPFVSVQPIAGAYVLRPRLRSFEPGWIAVMIARPGQSKMTLELLDPAGTVLQEVTSTAVATDFSVGGSLLLQGKALGAHFARYAVEHLGSCSAPI